MKKRANLRTGRIFSEAVRSQVVSDIEAGKVSVSAVSYELDVSRQTVYKWLGKYSRHLQTSKRVVVEMESEGYKSKQLEKRIQELEAALGRKQLEVDYLNKVLEEGKDKLGVDLKKKFATPPFNGSDSTGRNTGTK